MSHDTAVITCAVEDCGNRLRVEWEHLTNLLASGWTCPDHPRQEPRR